MLAKGIVRMESLRGTGPKNIRNAYEAGEGNFYGQSQQGRKNVSGARRIAAKPSRKDVGSKERARVPRSETGTPVNKRSCLFADS